MTYQILDHMEEVVKVVTVETIEEANDEIYDLKDRHGFQMEYTLNEI